MKLFSNAYKTMKLIRSSQKYMEIYKNINPILTDVSLQSKNNDKLLITKKKDLLHEIVFVEKPSNIEVGAFESHILPKMGDTDQIFQYASNMRHLYGESTPIYPKHLGISVVVPEYKYLEEALRYNVKQMSFYTSCSNSYQKRGMNKTLSETKDDLNNIFDVLKKEENKHIKTKLYISCVNECAMEGKIDIDYILHEIFIYNNKYELDEICLSDTYGSLTFDDYKYIVDALIYFGVLRTKIGVQLHVDTSNQYEMAQIVRYSLQNKITRFDVSLLYGSKENNQNMTYEFFYGCLKQEMESQMNKIE